MVHKISFINCNITISFNFRIYGAFTMDVIASSAFSTKIDSHNDPNNKFVATAREAFTRLNRWRLIVLSISFYYKLMF